METKNYFLGSVGRVEAFRETDEGLKLAFVSKTLTDSGINTSITADDIRAGQGAPIVTRFYHDASVEITLTDVMFKRAYVEAQLGAKFEEGGSEAYQSEELVGLADNKLALSKEPLPLGSGCSELTDAVVWFCVAGTNDWDIYNGAATENLNHKWEISHNKIEQGEKYCVRYLAVDASSYQADIFADIVPEELHLIITVPLYAGDACSASTGKAAGEVQFDIPRFRLNGSQDFAAAMSSNQTMSLAGAALASQKGCDTSAILYTMRIRYNSEDIRNEFVVLETLDESKFVGETPVIYGIKANNEAVLLNNEMLSFPAESLEADGTWKAAGTYLVTLREGITESITVEAHA